MNGAHPGSARRRAVSPARALLIAVACGSFAAASFLLARSDHDEDSQAGASPTPAALILRARPADGAAFRELADDASRHGDRARALRLLEIAVRRDPRDAKSQLQLVDAALGRRNAESALRHLDAALRVAPDAAEPALHLLLAATGDRAIRAALVTQLRADPPWRQRIPRLLGSVEPAAAQSLLSALSTRPLLPAELALQVSLLESLGRATEARAAWSAGLPAKARALDGLLFDGGFDYGEGPEPYGWRFPSAPEVLVGLEAAPGAQGGSALSVLLQGRAVVLPDVSQRLVLAPGPYALVLQADSALAGSGRGFAWVISCIAPSIELARLALPTQTRGWQRFATSFAVPPQCPVQTLRLVHEGRNLAERSLTGRLGVDAMQILPGPG